MEMHHTPLLAGDEGVTEGVWSGMFHLRKIVTSPGTYTSPALPTPCHSVPNISRIFVRDSRAVSGLYRSPSLFFIVYIFSVVLPA